MSVTGLNRTPSGVIPRLHRRRAEIERAILSRVYSVSQPKESADPDYLQGLRAAIGSALDYGLASFEQGDHRPSVPAVLLAQARLAARNGVSLDTVLRRYFAGFMLLGDFLIQEMSASGSQEEEEALHSLFSSHASLFDRLIVAVTDEYTREAEAMPVSAEQRRAERLQRLLDGEQVDPAQFEYEFDGRHLGAVIAGPSAPRTIRAAAIRLDCRLLVVRYDERVTWAWLGGKRRVDPAELECVFGSQPDHFCVACGEPAEGLSGWRLTHRQAKAALPIAQRTSRRFVRYAEVSLLAAALRDDLLATSLRSLYLEPLERSRDGGTALRETLRAFFAAGNNVSSAAAALCVNRNTIASRLHRVEELVGRPLSARAAGLETALQLEEIGDPSPSLIGN